MSSTRRLSGTPGGRTRLSDQIADELEGMILHQTLRTGDLLPTEADLAIEFDVSRTVVRDALRTLHARGLVESRPGRGTVIRAPNEDALRLAVLSQLMRADLSPNDVVVARATIDIGLAPFIAERATDEQIGAVRSSYEEFVAAIDLEDWSECSAAHQRFHVGLIDAVNTPALSIILSPMQHVIMLSTLPMVETWHRTWADEIPLHEAIVVALEAKSATELSLAITNHYDWLTTFPNSRVALFRDSAAAGELIRGQLYRTGLDTAGAS